ncbi:MAG: fibronectin type III domain-containing protein [Bryobacterales bacterium]
MLCLLAPGCGSVGEPRPPLLNIPERAQNLTARQTPEGIVLEWTWPRMTTEGVPLNDLARFDVYGWEVAPGSPVPDAALFERESRPLGAIEGDELAPYGPGERVRFVLDAAPLMGKHVTLGVRAESERGRSVGFSDLVVVEVIAPPAKPGQPSATLTRDAIVVEWPAVERASGYTIERSGEPQGPFETIGQSGSTTFRDAGYRVGELHVYRVRAIAGTVPGGAAGPPSEPVSITPSDVFAPARPSGVREVATETAVELSWEQNGEPDLAGYRVRRWQEGSEPAPIHDELLPAASYSDPGVARGQEYLYTVTAVDEEGNESEPSEAIRVRVPD